MDGSTSPRPAMEPTASRNTACPLRRSCPLQLEARVLELEARLDTLGERAEA